ncbi:hypothetical protein [Nonomuraea sp. NPDC046570]|uniref:hypothetical protein n=1 Tax=Nonomuraea sp. NPDC046570 TaxID=3155255 RepID=UPI0033D6EEC2
MAVPKVTGSASATASPATGLPERFTAEDGVLYRRLAKTTLDTARRKKVTLTVAINDKPLDIAVSCRGDRNAPVPQIKVGNRMLPGARIGPCVKNMQLIALPLPKEPGRVTVLFDATTHGTSCVRSRKDGPCEPTVPKNGVWTLGVYEWTPPDSPIEPPAVKAFPPVKGYRALEVKTGVWPDDSVATVRVRGGQVIGTDQLCTGSLARRLKVTVLLNGRATGVGGDCGVWEKGSYPMAMAGTKIPPGKDAELTIRFSMAGPVGNRPVRWSAGFWEETK